MWQGVWVCGRGEAYSMDGDMWYEVRPMAWMGHVAGVGMWQGVGACGRV